MRTTLLTTCLLLLVACAQAQTKDNGLIYSDQMMGNLASKLYTMPFDSIDTYFYIEDQKAMDTLAKYLPAPLPQVDWEHYRVALETYCPWCARSCHPQSGLHSSCHRNACVSAVRVHVRPRK